MAEENAICAPAFVTTAGPEREPAGGAGSDGGVDALQADSETPSTLVTGVVVVTFVEEHPRWYLPSLDHYQESVDSCQLQCGGGRPAGGPV